MTVQSTIVGTGALAGALGPLAGDPSASAAGLAAAAQPVSELAFTGAGGVELIAGLGAVLLAAGSLLVGLARRHRFRGAVPPTAAG